MIRLESRTPEAALAKLRPDAHTQTSLPDEIDTIVVGGSQAGLSVSYWLARAGHPHIVLEKEFIGATWAKQRWNSFSLVTPNWMLRLPGFPYRGDDPDGFLLRDAIVAYLTEYADEFAAPVHEGVEAERLSRDRSRYVVETNTGTIRTRNVVVCTGYFHEPRLPGFASAIDGTVVQLHVRDYKDPGQLPRGGVLVVGSGQSGTQIAEELNEAGRRVWLSVGSAAREPRRYRSRDTNYWYDLMGGFTKTFANPDDPRERYVANPHCSGKNGGHALNLEAFAEQGIRLVGRVKRANDATIEFSPDMIANVRNADEASRAYMRAIDTLIEQRGIDAPQPGPENTDDGEPIARPQLEETRSLDLGAEGIAGLVWATGFRGNYDWIDFPAVDARGYPRQRRGVSEHDGLYFCGLPWMHCLKSGLFFGVGEDAEHVSRHLLARR